MLGSLYLSFLLISCLSFDFGSAGTLRNSSEEEIEGYIFKENYCCGVGIGQFLGLNLDEALSKCTADSQCKCVSYDRTGDRQYYAWPLESPGPLAGTDAWIKDN